MPTFKIQGQIYHLTGSLLPTPNVLTNFCKYILWAIQQDKWIMRVELQNDQYGEVFAKHLFNIDNDKIPVDSSSGYIIFSTNFYHYTKTKTELIEKVFLNNAQNYKDHVWLNEKVILAAKHVDVNKMNFQIQNNITGELMTYKSIDSVTN
jgi:hypothetical protein